MSLSYLVFITDHTWSDRSGKLSFVFSVYNIRTTSHVIVLFGFHHSRYMVWLVTIVLFRFRRKLLIYDRSRHYPIWFSLKIVPNSFDHNSLVSFSTYTAPIWSITLLSCLVFVTNCTRFDRSMQLSFFLYVLYFYFFSVDHIYTISHIVVLSSFHHSRHLILSVLIVQFCFWCRPLLYDQSRCCPF